MALVVNHNMMAANTARTLNSNYNKLNTSVQRLSSGLRINSAADDAAGLAIRELMRSDITTLNQGVRNANDAISLIQTADGALGVIDEKLIRMKELAEQAATGTYTSTQRLIIDSEYQQMASEITRIANATDFNGIKLLDGTISSDMHDGSGLQAMGKLKVHFGTGNDCAEDYYYIQIGCCTASAFGVGNQAGIEAPTIPDPNYWRKNTTITGSNDPTVKAILNGGKADDGISATTGAKIAAIIGADVSGGGTHDATKIWATEKDTAWRTDAKILSFLSYFNTDGTTKAITAPTEDANRVDALLDQAGITGYNLNGGRMTANTWAATSPNAQMTYLEIKAAYDATATGPKTDAQLTTADKAAINAIDANVTFTATIATGPAVAKDGYDISTQEHAQKALVAIDEAIVSKDNIRAHIGALQNRFENTISNLEIQAENLQAAESRISDVDVATEMTQFIRNQILTQTGVAMLSQANSLPQMALQLLQ